MMLMIMMVMTKMTEMLVMVMMMMRLCLFTVRAGGPSDERLLLALAPTK